MADGATVKQCVSDVASYLDDTRHRRWTEDQVIRGLQGALSSCMEVYARCGGDRFDQEVEVTTDGASGVSLREQDPLSIKRVVYSFGDGQWSHPLHAADPGTRGVTDTSNRDLLIRYVPRPLMPTAVTDILVGLIPGDQRPWPAFERWVCMRAARELGIKDKDDRAQLAVAEAKIEREVCATEPIPRMLPWPRNREKRWGELRWLWFAQTGVMTLVQTVRT